MGKFAFPRHHYSGNNDDYIGGNGDGHGGNHIVGGCGDDLDVN